MNPNLVVEVLIRRGKAKGQSATGYVISSDRILTTGHLGPDESPIARGSQVWVRFVPSAPGLEVPDEKATVLWSGDNGVDCAILKCDDIPECQKGHTHDLRVRYDRTRAATTFEFHAWCNAGIEGSGRRDASERRVTEVRGTLPAMNDVQDWLSLDCEGAVPENETAWLGGSGAAVFAEHELVGIVRRCPENFRNRKVLAVPICVLMGASGFIENARLTNVEASAQTTLQNHAAVRIQQALTRLQAASGAWVWLLTLTGVTGLDDKAKTLDFVKRTFIAKPGLLVDLEELRTDLIRGQMTLDASTVADLQDMLLPLLLDAGVRRRLYHEIDVTHAAVVEGVAATPVGAEVAASHYSKRASSWMKRDGVIMGKNLISFPQLNPKQATLDSIAKAFLGALARRILDPSFHPSAAQALAETQTGECQPASISERELTVYRTLLNKEMQTRATYRGGMPYCALVMPTDKQERVDRIKVIELIKSAVPNLLFIELRNDLSLMTSEVPIASVIRNRLEESLE